MVEAQSSVPPARARATRERRGGDAMIDNRLRRLSLPTYAKTATALRRLSNAEPETVTRVRTKSIDEIGTQLSQQLKLQQLNVKPRKKDITKVKLISMGDAGVGKSHHQAFAGSLQSTTIGVDYGVKSVRFGANEVRINLFDLGRARFLTCGMSSTRTICGILVLT